MRYIDDKHHKLDKNISELSIKSDILKFIDPINKFDEYQKFVDNNGNYIPKFVYNDKHISAIEEVLKYIDKLSGKLDNYLDRHEDNLSKLMYEKLQELKDKFFLILSYHNQDIEKILYYNKALFGEFKKHKKIKLDNDALSVYKINHINDFIPSKIYDKYIWFEYNLDNLDIDKDILKKILIHNLDKIGVKDYKIKFEELGRTNMQVSIWKKPVIYVNKKSDYIISSVVVSILHEIHGHLSRRVARSDSDIYLLKWWTGYYLSDEEGVATFQWARYEWFQKTYDRLYESYNIWFKLQNLSRSDSVELLQSTKHKNIWATFRSLLRWKRWLVDVDQHCIFHKDKIYFDGYNNICNFIINWWDFNDLMIWRIKVDDLKYIWW